MVSYLIHSVLETKHLTECLVEFVIALVIIKILQIIWNARHLFRFSFQCQGPFIGTYFYNLNAEAVYQILHQITGKYESPIRMWFGPLLCLILHDPDDIQIILKHENSLKKPCFYKYLEDWIKTGLSVADVPIWKKHRKIVASTFNPSTLKSYMEVTKNQADVFVEQIGRQSDSQNYVDIFQYLSKYALDTVLESTMGVKIKSQTDSVGGYGEQYINAFNKTLHLIAERSFNPLYFFRRIFDLSKLSKELRNSTNFIHNFTNKIIEQKRASYKNDTKENEADDGFRKFFVDELLRQLEISNSEWSDDDVRDEICTVIVGGTDTSSHTLSFLILMLAMHPDVQKRIYEEIKNIEELIGDPDNLTIDTLRKIEYMNQVIMETMRLYPITTFIGRHTTGDVNLKHKNIVIPKSVTIVIGISALHRSKKYWGPNALKFDPENFSPKNREKRHPNAFIPFSDGPRNCIGGKFANIVMKVVLFKFLRKYRIETEEKFEDIRCEFRVVTNKVGGWKVKLFAREQ